MKRGVFIKCKNLWKVVFFSHHLIFLLTLQTASAPAARSRRRPARRQNFCVAGIHAVCGVWDMQYGTISNFGKFSGTFDINIQRSMGQSFNSMKEDSLSFSKIRETD